MIDLAARLYESGRYRDAHEQLDRAGALLLKQGDAALLARVDETRARVLMAEKKYGEARRVIGRAVETLEKCGGLAALAGALVTQGVVLARLGENEASAGSLRRAMGIAEWAGAHSTEGLAALALIEEHGARRAFSQRELYELFLRADRLLRDVQEPETTARRLACARIVMRRLAGLETSDKNFTFFSAVHEFEEKLIEWALGEAGGSVVRAARLLGLKHQTFSSMLSQRHKRLLARRTPREKRRRSIMRKE